MPPLTSICPSIAGPKPCAVFRIAGSPSYMMLVMVLVADDPVFRTTGRNHPHGSTTVDCVHREVPGMARDSGFSHRDIHPSTSMGDATVRFTVYKHPKSSSRPFQTWSPVCRPNHVSLVLAHRTGTRDKTRQRCLGACCPRGSEEW